MSEYRFSIDGDWRPDTIPMARLGAYMAAFAELLASRDAVHYDRTEEGSAVIVARADAHALPDLENRLAAIKAGKPPPDAEKAINNLNDLLGEDNSKGRLLDNAGAVILPFPGKARSKPTEWGLITQEGTLTGQIRRLGGESYADQVVWIADGDTLIKGIRADLLLIKQLGELIHGPVLRFHGEGRWKRVGPGQWKIDSFTVNRFERLDQLNLVDQVKALRQIGNGDWSLVPDPTAIILSDRHSEDDA